MDIRGGASFVKVSNEFGITYSDLELLADLFYLPFSYGPAGLRILELGHWLRDNAFSAPGSATTLTREVCFSKL
ncbi:unnamed protein product [Protopolystoma xenopodis]|uniref:Uncharacterized protein n=1 Tax=Protopolystoma xenopodis TaxID=117903 RepID=A0A3S5FD47_9PLAT|nr:unnamed protein product [Protopolystoma xenopodis]